jgi:cell wall-associated NlpC family hydrolase
MNAPFDRRVTPARADLAAASLKGRVEATRYAEGARRQCAQPVAPLTFEPAADARQQSQLLFGERFTVYEEKDGWAWGQAELDGYVGYVPAAMLGEASEPTHAVTARSSHLYPGPDLKLRAGPALGMGARVRAVEQARGFSRLDGGGWLYARHLAPLGRTEPDYVKTGLALLGVPYLWGGRSSEGLDCSGFVQLALTRAGIACPRDSDQQRDALGAPIEPRDDWSRVRHGDLVFFPGHVGFAVEGWKFLHANAFHMAVALEDFSDVLERSHAFAQIGVTCVRRLTPPVEPKR